MTKQKEKPALIVELEKQIGFPLKQLPLNKIYDEEKFIKEWKGNNYMQRGYATDETGHIIALSLDYIPTAKYSPQLIHRIEKLEIFSTRGGGAMKFLAEIKRLKRLDISDNQITDYSFLKELSGLNTLDLSSNQISDISFLKDLSSLNTLDLSANQISDISFLKDLSGLNTLYLSDNQISDYSFLKDLSGLNTLYLSYNQITDISFLKDLSGLNTLDLRNNQISDISFLKDLSSLNTLYLSYNQITDISFLKDLSGLNTLDLSDNQITDISFLKDLSGLNTLYLSYNQITDISFLKDLSDLNTLNLSANKITDYSFLKDLSGLNTLYLSYNQITDISFLKDLSGLNTLDLSDNQISDISFLKDLSGLYTLHLQNNPIKILPVWITDFKVEIEWEKKTYKSGAIFFYDNPLESPPVEIVKQGKEAIRNYFKQIKKEKEQYLFETKLLIIGEGGAGKTSLAKKLRDENAVLPKDEDTTLGIEVTKWGFEIEHSIRGKQTMYANLWDFGGQKLYQGTHQIFFSPKAFYILLDDTREEKLDFPYWMNTVEQLAGNESKLLIVINKKHAHVPQIDKNGLLARFGELITGFFTVDLLSDKPKIIELQDDLKRYLQKLPGIGDPLPASWVKIRKDLFDIDKSQISRDVYIKICKKHKTDLTKLDFLSDYFNRIGVFTHYYDDKLLKNRVYLNSNWLLNSVYEVLNHQLVKDKQGRINGQQLKEIWNNNEHCTETDYLSRLMHRFGMMYEVEGNDTFVVPAHLPMEQPYTQWEHEKQPGLLQFAYEFDKYMPRGIMPRLIVALNRLIKDQTMVWNKGVNICYESSHAEIKETYDKTNKYLIRIVGNQKKELLGIIINEFDKLLEPFRKLHYEKQVPCICSECINNPLPNFFEYSDLKRRKEKGKAHIECRRSYEPVSVERLLDGIESKMEKERIDEILTKPEKEIIMTEKELKGYRELLDIMIEKKQLFDKEKLLAYDVEKKFALQLKIKELEEDIHDLKSKFDGIVTLKEGDESKSNADIVFIKQKLNELSVNVKNIKEGVSSIDEKLDKQYQTLINKLSEKSLDINEIEKIINNVNTANELTTIEVGQSILGHINHAFEQYGKDFDDSLQEVYKNLKQSDNWTTKLKLSIPLLNLIGINLQHEVKLNKYIKWLRDTFGLSIP